MTGEARAGFTLVEMMIVLAVVAMSALFLGPMLHRGTSPRDLEMLGRRIALAARTARLEAMRHNSVGAVAFDPQSRSFGILPGPERVALPADVSAQVKAGRELEDGGLGTIRFLPDGRSSGGDIRLSTSTARIHLTVDWLTGWVGKSPS